MNDPTYDIDDVIYIRSSAANGFIEKYKIISIRADNHGTQWVYRINHARGTMEFTEDEFIDECDALDLVIAHLQRRLTDIDDKYNELCGGTN